MKRRTFMIGGSAGLLAGLTIRESARADVSDQFLAVERHVGGRLGVAALDTRNGARLAYRDRDRFAMCSTFKWMLAAAVLANADRDAGVLERSLPVEPNDLLAVSPITGAHVGGALSVKALCEAAVEVSDNTAANLLLRFIGGPPSLTHFIRGLGDRTTRLDRFEPGLNSNIPGDPRDTTTPDAMVGILRTILVGHALSPNSRELLIGWLENCSTGRERLRAGLPPTWTAGDKTGTGVRGAVNDVAIAWPPGRPPVLIAVYMSGSQAAPDALNAVHARIGEIVAGAFA